MRSMLAASPLSLGALVLRIESGSCAMENPINARQRPLEHVELWLGIQRSLADAGLLQGAPVHRSVDKLGNFIS